MCVGLDYTPPMHKKRPTHRDDLRAGECLVSGRQAAHQVDHRVALSCSVGVILWLGHF